MFSDQISSTSLTRDDAGVNKVQRYTPWGETRTDGGLGTDHTYTGQIEDTTTGLRFYNARYMDPVLGRFVSPDTIVRNAGNGQDYNRYAYVRNNPVKYNDPTGNVFACSGTNCGQDVSNIDFGFTADGLQAFIQRAASGGDGTQIGPPSGRPGIVSVLEGGAYSSHAGGTFSPVPGAGTVRVNLWIPDDRIDTFLIPVYGDNRDASPTAGLESSKAVLVIDFEEGVLIGAFSPSCRPGLLGGRTCDDAFPTTIVVGQGLDFDDIVTENGFAVSQSGSEILIHIRGKISVGPPLGPSINGVIALSIDGSGAVSASKSGDGFPAHEVYQDVDGRTVEVEIFREGSPIRLLGNGE